MNSHPDPFRLGITLQAELDAEAAIDEIESLSFLLVHPATRITGPMAIAGGGLWPFCAHSTKRGI
jgi:hypothetical protein